MAAPLALIFGIFAIGNLVMAAGTGTAQSAICATAHAFGSICCALAGAIGS